MIQAAIRLAIVDDRPLIRDVVALRIQQDARFTLVYVAASDMVLKRSAATRGCELLLLNAASIAGPEELRWISIVRQIRTQSPGTRVVLSAHEYLDRQVVAFLEAGAAGFVPADATWEQLGDSLRSVFEGRPCCPAQVLDGVLRRVRELLQVKTDSVQPLDSLSDRESEVVRLVAEGHSNKDIAQSLGISVSTTKNHVHSIRKKLGIHRRRELLGFC